MIDRSPLNAAVADFRSSWKALALTDIAFKVIGFVLLTPVLGGLARLMIAVSGGLFISDFDILVFLLRPPGWLCLIVVGALGLGIVALEQAALMAVLSARATGGWLGSHGALRFAFAHVGPVVGVTARMVGWLLLAVAPFLGVAAAVYFMLPDYDINYFLKETPPIFWVGLAVGGVMLLGLAALALRLLTSWLLAVPLVVFENVSPSDALRASAARASGHRRTFLAWIAAWAIVTSLLSAMVTGLIGIVGRVVVSGSAWSLQLLVLVTGLIVLSWLVSNVVVTLFGSTTFACLLFALHRHVGGKESATGRAGDSAPRSAAAMRPAGPRVSPRGLLLAAVVGVGLAGLIGIVTLQSVSVEDDIQIMAHRGSSQAAPENTMAAIRKAIEDGADWVEIDVQETADGDVVVFHDSDLMRVAGRDLKIWDATMDDLKAIDVGSWFSDDFAAERVPTLAAVLRQCRGRIGVIIELKYYGHEQKLEQRVADIVESTEMASEVMLMSLKRDGVRKMKKIRPNWKVGLLLSVSIGNLKGVEADFFAVNAAFADWSFIRAAHDIRKDVYVWTVNDARTMSTMIGRGVDGLLTDRPALARSVLEQRARMSTPERLLLQLAGILGAGPEIEDQ